MSCCIEPKIVIEKLRNAYNNNRKIPFDDNELRSFCVVSLCEKLRNEVEGKDYELVKWMLAHSNCYLANLGQALLRPFIEKYGKKDELKFFLTNLWESTENDCLKSGLLFDLFLYSEDELGSEFVNRAFTYLEEKNCAFSLMLEEWLEDKEKILDVIKKHISENKSNPLKTALWLFSLISVPRDKSKEAKEVLDIYTSESNPVIKKVINFDRRLDMPKRYEALDEIAKKWWDYLRELKHSIEEGAESVFSKDDVKVKIFINIRNRHLSYQTPAHNGIKIPQLQWRYAGLEEKDIVGNGFKKGDIIKFFSVELFGGGFLSPSFHVENYIKLIPLEEYFSKTDSIAITDKELSNFIQEFNSSKEDKFGSEHPRSNEEEKCLRQILAYKLNKFFWNIGKKEKERYEKILKLVERKTLFKEDEIKKGISVMLAVTFGAYYPMDIFVTLIPEGDSNKLIEGLKKVIDDYYGKNTNEKGKTVSFWELEKLDKSLKTKIILLERALSQVVMHLFTKIYALYFQHLIAKGKDEIIKNGVSVMLSVPAELIEIKGEKTVSLYLKIELDKDKSISLPYPVYLDPHGNYRDITQFKVKELLIKLDEYYTNILNEQKKLRMKDAVVAIMGRNMSHNIGSHVLWHLGEDLTLDPQKNEKEKTETKIKNFYSYLRERMGFIALIATERPSWAVERLFKTAVDHFAEMDLLQKNIVLTEKLIKNGEEYRFNPIVQLDSESNERLIEFPHGSYGEQALYIILENIIRNTIKHNRHKLLNNGSNGNIPINFVLSVTEPPNEKWKRDYWKVTIRDDLKKYSESLDELVKKLQKKADENIFDDLGKPKRTNLGFKEKRICAAFLRMIPQEDIDSEELKSKISKREIPPLLTIDKWENNGEEHLAHIIYLRKPKKALLISGNEGLMNNNHIQSLEDKGIYITHKDKAEELLNTDPMNYKFLVLMLKDKPWTENFVNKYYMRLPHRILSTNTLSTNRPYTSISCCKNIKSNLSNPDALYSLFWKAWLDYFGSWKKHKVYIIESSKQNSLKNIPANYYQVVDAQFNKYNNSSIVLSHDKDDIDEIFFNHVFVCEGYSGTEGVGGIIEMVCKPEFSYLYEQLLESFLLKIVVIDERIFDKKDIKKTPPKFKTELSVETLWNKRGVRILNPDKFIEGDWSEIDKPHILIIHQGVIDKYNESHKGENEFENRWEEEIKKQIPYLVIDSDRGKPDGVERLGAIWIQFSDLGDIMVHKAENSLSKYLLVDILTSLREERK